MARPRNKKRADTTAPESRRARGAGHERAPTCAAAGPRPHLRAARPAIDRGHDRCERAVRAFEETSMSRRIGTRNLSSFWREERGDLHPTTSLLVSTLAIAIPLGLMLWAIYGSLCESGRQANLMIGIF